MDLIKNLKEIGLSENQAKVYLACLQLGQDSVLNIAKSAELKRPSVYLLLEELENKGLISQVKKVILKCKEVKERNFTIVKCEDNTYRKIKNGKEKW